ncbi:MAG: FG-GAP-like repeat-containing protein, partial [Cyclobacteriaceae bacterium]|nr:FG-GAP-like repeat-containing protein [Cyclobacteriaceae bacterium]
RSANWLPQKLTASTASAVGDLDNDGDLDLVVNNVDEKASIYINQTDNSAAFLKVALRYTKSNPFGIGTKIYAYSGGVLQFKELYTVRGFQASSEPILHFGFGKSAKVDSINVVWANGKVQKLKDIKANQTLIISLSDNIGDSKGIAMPKQEPLFKKIDPKELGLTFEHQEDPYTDFDRVKLLPYQQSDRGPATALGDINNDGLTDVYFGGSKHVAGRFYLQSGNQFVRSYIPTILKDSIKEDVDAVIEDFNNDGKTDLFIGTGGADFFNKSKPLLDSYYESNSNGFSLEEIEGFYENASCVKPFDFDKDGDLDLFVGNESVSKDFGKMPKSYLLVNEKGKFVPSQNKIFESLGMITDTVWDDYDKDGQIDLIVVGEWMEPVFLKNKNGSFQRDSRLDGKLGGLWQMIVPFDIDGDGSVEYILGNWGLNSKYRASRTNPMKMYYGDFDENDEAEPIIAIEKNGRYYPLEGFDMLASQLPSLHKKYSTYKAFAGQTIEQIFTANQLKKSVVFEVNELGSGYLKERNGKYVFMRFPNELQVAPILAQAKFDFDFDGKEELLLGGNYFGVQPFQGRFGSFAGAILKNDGKIVKGNSVGLDLIDYSVRQLNLITLNDTHYLLVTINNGKAQFYKILENRK